MFSRIAVAAALAFASMPLAATTYTLEPDYTQGIFRWNHLGFSNPAAQVSQGAGKIEFDAARPSESKIEVTIPLSTLNTGVPALDEHMRSEDFFEVAKFPTATFKSTRVERGATADRLRVTGDLTLHGMTHPVILDARIVKIGINPRTDLPTVGFDATTTIKRSAFGLGAYVPQVSDEIELHVITQAVEAKAQAEYLKKQEAQRNGAAK
jgi:polyisoprenoid-binding protein YceI